MAIVKSEQPHKMATLYRCTVCGDTYELTFERWVSIDNIDEAMPLLKSKMLELHPNTPHQSAKQNQLVEHNWQEGEPLTGEVITDKEGKV